MKIDTAMPPSVLVSSSQAIASLSALGEETRLRLYALLSQAELTVSEVVAILGQSQPRVSRHLKLLLEAGLVERHREGVWAFFLASSSGPAAQLGQAVFRRLNAEDPHFAGDRTRLNTVRAARAAQAQKYFDEQAPIWNETRKMHALEAQVEAAIVEVVLANRSGDAPLGLTLDIGTGSGRMLELLAPYSQKAIGVDLSPAMLSVARAQIEKAGLRNVQLRQGDIYALPFEAGSFDLIMAHQVLHYLDDPARALREAARGLKPDGRLIVVDFGPHEREDLRERHAHRRLGFSTQEMTYYLREAGLELTDSRNLKAEEDEDGLSVSLWLAQAEPLRKTGQTL